MLLGDHKGNTPVYVQLKEEKKAVRMMPSVDLGTGIEEALQLSYGKDRVLVRETKK